MVDVLDVLDVEAEGGQVVGEWWASGAHAEHVRVRVCVYAYVFERGHCCARGRARGCLQKTT